MVSDFNEFDEAARKIMATLAKKTQLYCVNVYDVLEDNAPKPGEYMAAKGNDRLVFETRTKAFRNAYHAYLPEKRGFAGVLPPLFLPLYSGSYR